MSKTMNILAFAASTSRASINKQLVTHAAGLIADATAEILDLNDYEVPLFSVDLERETERPQKAIDFLEKIGAADALLISFAEHNGAYTAAFKNLFDWCSRIDPKVYQGKPVVMLATSPGARGAAGVLELAIKSAPHFGADLRGSLSVPSFNQNFDDGHLTAPELQTALSQVVNKLR